MLLKTPSLTSTLSKHKHTQHSTQYSCSHTYMKHYSNTHKHGSSRDGGWSGIYTLHSFVHCSALKHKEGRAALPSTFRAHNGTTERRCHQASVATCASSHLRIVALSHHAHNRAASPPLPPAHQPFAMFVYVSHRKQKAGIAGRVPSVCRSIYECYMYHSIVPHFAVISSQGT